MNKIKIITGEKENVEIEFYQFSNGSFEKNIIRIDTHTTNIADRVIYTLIIFYLGWGEVMVVYWRCTRKNNKNCRFITPYEQEECPYCKSPLEERND